MKSIAIPASAGEVSTHSVLHRFINADKVDFKTDQELYIEAITGAIHEPVVILEKDLTIQSVNKAFLKAFKVTRKSMLGKPLFLNSDDNLQAKKLIRRLQKLSKNNAYFEELELTYPFRKIGERTLLINAKRIVYDNDRFDFILLSIEDITQRKRVERQKDDFVGYVTHELKTPITSLSAFIQLLQGYHAKTGDKKSQFLLAKIAGQLENLTKLLNSFTNVYKAQTGMLVLQKESVDLYELVRETVEMFQYTTVSHTISIDGMLDKHVFLDKERIRQVVINLLINAIKYSPDAETIVVKLSGEKSRVIVSIQDFGPGIPKEAQSRIFERFFRISDKNQNYNVKGLGLGLYISLEIVKAHNGKLWVESAEGKGSTFSFSLPTNNVQKDKYQV
jgi:PAS domain S-box-containing protein